MNKINRSNTRHIIIAVTAVFLCFIVAVKALSSVTTIIFKEHYIVCIDPGHGGTEAGALSNGKNRKEKDDNLKLSLKVKEKLEEKNVEVIMTRNSDTTVTLKNRCVIANDSDAQLFVSIHRNSSPDGTGIEVWIKDSPTDTERELADGILSSLAECTGLKNRGVKCGYRNTSGKNYYVNANTKMPSCLVEAGFITNENDNNNFDEKTDEYAESIANAVFKNLEKIKNNYCFLQQIHL